MKKQLLRTLFLFVSVMTSNAVASTETCGVLKQIVLEPANPAGSRLQISIEEKVTKKKERLNVSESIRKSPETAGILQLALQDAGLELCLSKNALGVIKN